MRRNIFAVLLVLALVVTLAACGTGEETTLTGIVVELDGTVITLVERDTGNMGGRGFTEGERPEKQEGMENFDPEAANGTLPNGETIPQRGDKERPQGERPEMPEGGDKERPQGERPEMPEGSEQPEGMTPPEDGEMTAFGNENRFKNFMSDAETKELDIGNAHISLEEDGVKASGSLDDIKPGSFVTVTMNGKGEVTNVLVSASAGFGRGGRAESN